MPELMPDAPQRVRDAFHFLHILNPDERMKVLCWFCGECGIFVGPGKPWTHDAHKSESIEYRDLTKALADAEQSGEPEPDELPPYSRGFPIGFATSDFELFNNRPGSQVLWKGNITIPAPRMPEQPIKRRHAVRNMLASIRVGAWRQAGRWFRSFVTGKFRGQIVNIVG